MKIVLVQYDIAWESPSFNLIKIENMFLNETEHFDLILLPEMFNTGFSMNPHKIAETMEGDTINWMKNFALQKDAVIAGSVSIKENGLYYNRFLAVYPNGKIEKYDKKHLFRMSDEDLVYTPGNKNSIIDLKGWRCALFVCYDIRFPVWCRNRNNYDLALFNANWPKPRIDVWKTLLKARAIENQCYTAGVNRIGNSNEISYNGHSYIYDYLGNIIGSLKEDEEGLIKAELSLNKLNQFKEKFPAWMDADDFTVVGSE
ncbi:MAG: amidohydrolase [Marinilabiliaceae bacterium]|nr:amidohydrolase [Marinilabiliaceae bacterium]